MLYDDFSVFISEVSHVVLTFSTTR